MKKINFFQPAVVFLLMMAVCLSIIVPATKNLMTTEKVRLEQLNTDNTIRISEAISAPINQLYTVARYIEKNHGDISGIGELAELVTDREYVRNLIIAPDGIVSQIYPDNAENRQVIGLDYFSNSSEGNREAVIAAQTKDLLLAGPFKTVVGDQAISGRLPVFIKNEKGKEVFWGLLSITLYYPQILENTYIDDLKEEGITYELWHKNIDTSKNQIILSNGKINESDGYVDKPVKLLNAEWFLRLSPVKSWYEFSEVWIYLVVAVFISFLIAIIVNKNTILNQTKNQLEKMLRFDPLTNILNRQGLFSELKNLVNSNCKFQVNYLDLNQFKNINDKYGHSTGDIVLSEFARRVNKYISKNYIFARMSGDEFIIVYIADKFDSSESEDFWLKLEKEFLEPIVIVGEEKILLTFSRGYSIYPDDAENLDDIISIADEKMYVNKKGRK